MRKRAAKAKYADGGNVRSGFRTGGTDLTENAREEAQRRAEERSVNSLADSYVRIGAVARKQNPNTGDRARDLRAGDVNRARVIADETLQRRRGASYQSALEGGPKEYRRGGRVSAKKGKK